MNGNTDICTFERSLRRNSSTVWRSQSSSVFSRSTNEEDDEEALVWAALEKLPTYDRLRTGILKASNGVTNEVDVNNLGVHDKNNLVQRLINTNNVDEDNEKLLLKLKTRFERVGIDIPTVEVRYENLNVEAEVYVGSRALPSFVNFIRNIVEGFLGILRILPNKKKNLTILQDVSGIIKPNRMTLLLGPPSSGKTTLLLALSGKLDKTLKVSGRVTYNGHNMNEFVPQKTAAYISQHDVHIGEMTVRETLDYAARFQGAGHLYEMLVELSRREKEAGIRPDCDLDLFMKASAVEGHEENVVVDYIIKILGLEVCADTMVGDQMIRGISGGQRKRVTTGEMLVGPVKTLFMDEISTGLDSSTTYQIVNLIRQSVHILDGTAVISLLQPSPETYNLFDDVILLSDGLIVYQGPIEHVLEFFESMGFKCPERKGIADFLQEVTSKKDQQQYWVRSESYTFISSKEFAEAFHSFHVGRQKVQDLRNPYDKNKSHPTVLTTNKYGIGKRKIFKACMDRELLLMKKNSFVYIFRLFQLLLRAFIAMTVFFRTKMHKRDSTDGNIFIGSLFFAVVMIMFNGLAEMSMTIAKLQVFYKQRDQLFFPGWAYALPSWFLKIPITLFEAAVWVFTTYYVIGYDPYVGRLFKLYLILVLVNQMASSLFRAIGALGRTMIIANTFGIFILVILCSLNGFVLSRNDVKGWWIWGYWSSPVMYALNAVLVNEFLGHSWSQRIVNNVPLGVKVLTDRGFFPYAYWFWIGAGALVGFITIFNLIYIIALTYMNPLTKSQGILVKDDENKNNGNGRVVELIEGEVSQDNGKNNVVGRTQLRKRGMILPFEQHLMTFEELCYSVDMPWGMREQGVKEDRLELLKGVSGAFRPGVLTALMGVSGAGKTTLMDVLAGRKTGGYIDGDIKISGHSKKQETFARISGYCEQNDIHSPHVTVYESLLYSAWLRVSREIDVKTREIFVEEVMELVELTSLRGALVGLPGVSGLSVEQRKRLTIAVELVANPSIIFMDEPTSGLDARAAAIVMRTVRNTVDTGRTVVCTIHQPSIDIFEAFDELFLMRRGGEEIYVGPLGDHCCELIKYFEGIQGVPKIPNGYNPATWMLEVSTRAQEAAHSIDFTEYFRNSDLFRSNKALIQELKSPKPGSKDLYFVNKYSQSFVSQTLACVWKQRLSYWRNTSYAAVRFLSTIVIALLFGTTFWKLGHKIDKTQHLINSMGSMYAAVLFLGMQNASSIQPVVAIERIIYYREKAAGMYSALPYASAMVLVEVPYILVQATTYSLLVYSMIGFQWTVAKFFWYLFFMFFTLLCFTFYGMMSVAITPNHHIAAIVSALFYGIWNLFSGFIIPKPRIPPWWRWYYYLCPVSWTLYGLIASQFGDLDVFISDSNYSPKTVKVFIENYFDYKHEFLGGAAGIIIAFAFVFVAVFTFAIRTFNFQKQ